MSDPSPAPRRGRLSGRVVLVTGASSGLGEAVAEACHAAGASVVLTARRRERLRALAERLGDRDRTLVVPGDIRDPDLTEALVAAAHERFGRVDVLVANAGVGKNQPLVVTSEAWLQDQVTVNLVAVVRCARAVLPGMLERNSGHVITMASVAGEIGSSGATVYAATKAGVLGFTESLRRELRGTGVTASAVLPGFIRSEMTKEVTFPMPPASAVGKAVVRLILHPRPRVVVPRLYGALIWANRLFPGAVDVGAALLGKNWKRAGRESPG